MKHFLNALFFALPFITFSQAIILQEDFTDYQATTQTMPARWIFSYQGNYTSSTFCGNSGPNAYKFGAAKATINTPAFFPGVDSVKFWIKGSSTDTISKLIVLESADSLAWDTLTKICPLPTQAAKGKRSFAVKSSSTHLRFTYIKSVGNLAFDDFKLLDFSPSVNFTVSDSEGCAPMCIAFAEKSTISYTTWLWNFGDGSSSSLQNPMHCYVTPGSYTIKLKAGNGTLTDSIIKINFINIDANPIAAFSSAPSTAYLPNAVVQFTDKSTGTTNWDWNFDDGQTSVLQNPQHTYQDTGMYVVWLTVKSAHGCIDTVTHIIYVKSNPTGIEMVDLNSFSCFPNPSTGLFTIHLNRANSQTEITISNVLGESIQSLITDKQTETINLGNAQPGIYFITIRQGNERAVRKIVIER